MQKKLEMQNQTEPCFFQRWFHMRKPLEGDKGTL